MKEIDNGALLLKKKFHSRSSHQSCSVKKCVLKNFANFTGKHLFSYEICEICKNTYFDKNLRTTASVSHYKNIKLAFLNNNGKFFFQRDLPLISYYPI